MAEKVFIVSNRDTDINLIAGIIDSERFDIVKNTPQTDIEDFIHTEDFAAIIADHDFMGDRVAGWIDLLHRKRSRSCLILYGENSRTENIAEILQKGAYGFIPRNMLEDRIYDTLEGGLENRKIFIEILSMIDEQKNINERLEQEKIALGKKNQELDFINRLSYEVARDLNWEHILPKIIDAGFLKIIDTRFVSILYRIGNEWNFSCYLPDATKNNNAVENIKKDICNKFSSISGEKISAKEVKISVYPSDKKDPPDILIRNSDQLILPLIHRERALGALAIMPQNRNSEILSTILNILVMSLNNVQEYERVKKMTIRDGLTGVFNQLGFKEFIENEFRKARRYNRPLSLIMIDVDNFKVINDSLGHLAGDYVLIELVNCLKYSLRKSDILVRYGGDEFAIILPDTKLEDTKVLIERILLSIKTHIFEWKYEKIFVDVSIGISAIGELGLMGEAKDLIEMADSRLYDAKRRQHRYDSVKYNGIQPAFGSYATP